MMTEGEKMPVLTTTLTEIPRRRVVQVLGVVFGDGEGIAEAFAAMEEEALECGADAIIDVCSTTAGAVDRTGRAVFRVNMTGTAVRLDPGPRRSAHLR